MTDEKELSCNSPPENTESHRAADADGFRILNIPEAEPDELVRIGHGLWRQQNNYATNPCVYCSSNCCRLRVDLTVIEALRMAYTLVMPLLDFVVDRKPTDMKPAKLCHPFRLHDGPSVFSLVQSEGYCVHLVRPGQIRSRCGIYELRPAICRLYPFTMEQNGTKIEMGTEEHCPVQWMQTEDTRLQAHASLIQFQKDYEEDRKWIEEWNQKGRKDLSLESFVEFLMYKVGPALGYNPKLFTPLPERRLGKKLFHYQSE